MQRPAVFVRRAVLRFAGATSVRCRLLSSTIPVLSPKQQPLHLSSQTLLRAVSSSSSSFSSGSANASLSTVTADATATRNDKDNTDASTADADASYSSSSVIYVGPLTRTFRRLKIFSLSSLALASSLSPFIFIVESSLPSTARVALATTALATSGVSTALVAWCGRPYVTALRNLATTTTTTSSLPASSPSNTTLQEQGQEQEQEQEQTTAHSHSHNENVPAGIEMTTLTLTLSPLTTRVYDPAFLCDTTRAFARWELARSVQLPSEDAVGVRPGSEETVAETMDGAGNVLGRWIVTWGENGEGSCRAEGRIET